MKVQYPGVAESIESDLSNLKRLVLYTSLAPRGLYLDNIIKVAGQELAVECDYELELKNQQRFKLLAKGIKGVNIPEVVPQLSTKRVLTTHLVKGIPIDQVANLSQSTRDRFVSTTYLH